MIDQSSEWNTQSKYSAQYSNIDNVNEHSYVVYSSDESNILNSIPLLLNAEPETQHICSKSDAFTLR